MEDLAVEIDSLSKVYRLYEKTTDRLKELLFRDKKQFGEDFYALRQVSVKIRKGETVGIIGKNGAGKSTLLKLITEVLAPTEGSINVNGRISALLELGAGFNPEYTGMENIFLHFSMLGIKNEEIEKKVPEIAAFADIGDFINQPVKSYSSGMFARLAFAAAVSSEPEILIVDEALSVGDTKFQIKCMEHMKKMMGGGTTVLFVSHDINAVRRFCRRAVWIHAGRVKMDGKVNPVCDAYLDFLKCAEPPAYFQKKKIPGFARKEGIAEIVDFSVKDRNGEIGDEVYYDTPLEITVTYDVYDKSFKNAVLGVALRSKNDDYTCGLNTLLDHAAIPWDYGRNKMKLNFPCGIRAAGGEYYFEAALEDQTATVGFHYIQRIRKIYVRMDYECEGRYSIPHVWEAG